MSQATFDSYLLAVQQLAERQQQLDAQLAEFGAQEPYREPVACAALLPRHRHGDGGLPGGRAARLPPLPLAAPALMAYVGLVPSECSSGERERRGSITKAGNRHVRRLLVEAAWHQRIPSRAQPAAAPAARRTTGAGAGHRRPGPGAALARCRRMSAARQDPPEDRRRHGARADRLPVGGPAPGAPGTSRSVEPEEPGSQPEEVEDDG